MKRINIKGPIVSNDDIWIYEWLDMEATSPKTVHEKLAEAGDEDVEVIINSGGGSVFDGSEIYTSIKEHSGNVTVKIVGVAASAASVIAMAGDRLLMSPTSQMMIHNATSTSSGDYRDMEHTSSLLKNVNETIANAYKIKSGMSGEELKEMMDYETWLTPQQALDKKLIDEVMFEDALQVVASYDSGMLPKETIDKIRNEIVDSKSEPPNNRADFLLAKLNLLKLKGAIN